MTDPRPVAFWLAELDKATSTVAQQSQVTVRTEHPPLKPLHQTNLPVPATPFLGREAEVAEIAAPLRDEVRSHRKCQDR